MSNHSTKNSPKISVLVPCYNSEIYLIDCLVSLQNQTLTDIEFICINDGSQDSTQLILESFQAKDERFVVVNKKNTGYGDSLNLGLSLAKGEYIGIIEPDDFAEPEMFKVLYKMASEFGLDIARCSYFYNTKTSDIKQNWPNVPKNKVINPNNYAAVFNQGPSVWANLYRHSWLKQNSIYFLPTPGASYQDTSFTFKAYFCAQKFMMTDNCLLHYRIDNENSSVHDKKKVFCVMDEWEEIYNFVSLSSIKNIFIREKLEEFQHRTYLWNLGRLDSDAKTSFIKKWHEEATYRRRTHQTNLSRLSFFHFILEAIVLYCPSLLIMYNKKSLVIRLLKKLVS